MREIATILSPLLNAGLVELSSTDGLERALRELYVCLSVRWTRRWWWVYV